MASLQSLQFRYSFFPLSPKFLLHSRTPQFSRLFPSYYPRNARVFSFSGYAKARNEAYRICCFSKVGSEIERLWIQNDDERPDINLAVVLAGFAFEAYTTPPENIRRREVDAAGCKTVHLSEQFVSEIYDGQLFIRLKKGFDFPAMDPWGTSDPYLVIQFDSQTAKSKIKWDCSLGCKPCGSQQTHGECRSRPGMAL